jgi:hypothetical protein
MQLRCRCHCAALRCRAALPALQLPRFYEGNDDQWIFIPGLDWAGVKINDENTPTYMFD